ncbi:MAG: GNVR domain-containing protein [bacterium]
MSYHEILNTIIFNRKPILLFTISVTIFLFLLLLFVVPLKFISSVKILPPEEQSYGGLQGLLGSSDFSDMVGLGSAKSNSQLYAEILKSRSASEYVVKKCNLLQYFDTKNSQLASEKLMGQIDVEVTKEGIIILKMETATPLFSRYSEKADEMKLLSSTITNTFVEALDNINLEKLNLKAKKSRIFVEQQLSETKYILDSVEIALKNFQDENKTIDLPEQLSAAIENAAKIKSEILFAEVQLSTFGYNMRSDSPEMDALNKKLKVLKDKYSEIEGGENLEKDYLPTFKEIPAISLEMARLLRDVKIQNELYLLLQKQYYKEKIQENKDIPTVQVLDAALPPLNPSSPRLVFHTLLGGISAFILISLIFIFLENKRKSILKRD